MKLTKVAAMVFFLLALTYAYFYQEPGSNGNTRLALTMAIVKERRLNIDTFISHGYTTGDLAIYQGKYYTDKAIGSSVLGAVVYYPIFRILNHFGIPLSLPDENHLLTFLVLGLPSAIAGTLIFIMCEFLSKSRFRAFIVTLAIALGTMCFPFSVNFFGHQLAASFLFGAFFMIFLIKIQQDQVKLKNFYIFLIGLLLGLALLTDLTTAVVVLPLIVYYFYVLWTRKLLRRVAAWVIPAIGGLLPILVMVAYNFQVYGTPFAIGYQYLFDPTFKQAMAQGIMGIGLPRLDVLFYETLHPAQGIFWQSPVLIMTLVGGFFMLRKKQFRAELAVTAITCGAYLLLNAGYYMWWGGDSFSVREIVPMLPFLCLPLIFVPRKIFPIVIVLTFVSVAQMGIVAASEIGVPGHYFTTISSSGFFEFTAIYDYCLKQLIAGKFAWNIGLAFFNLKSWTSLLPISIAVLGATLFMAFYPTRMDHNPQNLGERLAT
jgi:hypothetical protein